VQRIKHYSPKLLVETLVGDFQGVRRDVDTLIRDGKPDVFAHNVEVVPRAAAQDPRRALLWQRVDVLRWAKEAGARSPRAR
jgi:lipoic acid synthetase